MFEVLFLGFRSACTLKIMSRLLLNLILDIRRMKKKYPICINNIENFLIGLQLSELEQRVIEAEERAEDAEDKVCNSFVQ